jgi:protein ImuB
MPGLWLCAHLPRLPLDSLLRARDFGSRPVVVHDSGQRPARIVTADDRALERGIGPPMTLGAAHALAPDLLALARKPEAETAMLSRLASWCGQFTPVVSIAPPDSLLLDIAASLRLFGGSQRLLQALCEGVTTLGFRVVTAMAPTAGAALWLGRGADAGEQPVPPWRLTSRIGSLSIRVLDLPLAQQRRLRALGVARIADLLRLPRDGLGRRFGTGLVDALDRALGQRPDPRPRHVAPERFEAAIELPAETTSSDLLLRAAGYLIDELHGYLRARCGGVRRLHWMLRHCDGHATHVRFDLRRAVHDRDTVYGLLRERLERTETPQPVTGLALISGAVETHAPETADLLPGARARTPESLETLIERLRARLGEEAVRGLRVAPRHCPEQAWQTCTPGQGGPEAGRCRRPLWLLDTPRRLRTVNGRPYLDSLLIPEDGAERIESGWWEDAEIARDYYVVQDARGSRLWIFRDLHHPEEWFLHGVFG